MKCKIENCDFEGQDLTTHIIRKHKMLICDYIEKFGNEIVDSDLKLKRKQSRKDKYEFFCPICNQSFGTHKGLENHLKDSKDIEHNHLLYNDSNKEDWVECLICSWRSENLIKHIGKHNLKVTEYSGQIKTQKIIDREKEIQENLRNSFPFECPVSNCKTKFKSEKALKRHLITSDDLEHNHIFYNDSNKETWVECKICKIRKNVLSKHLQDVHNMSSEYYKKHYNAEILSSFYKNNNMQIFHTSAIEAKKEKYEFEKNLKTKKEISENYIMFNESNKNDWVECQIEENGEKCGFRSERLSQHLKSKHNITTEIYKEKYNMPIISKNLTEKLYYNWGDFKENAQKRKTTQQKCSIENCNNIVIGEKVMCDDCKEKTAKKIQELKFRNKKENYDFIRCKCKLKNGEICNWPDTRISEHIKKHNYSTEQYKKEFGEDAFVVSPSLASKTAFRGKHSEETKKQMSFARKYQIPWNYGLTKEVHPGLKIIADKAYKRMTKLENNNWHTNPVNGERNGMKGKKPWSFGLNKENSEFVEKRNETNSSIEHHKSNFNTTNEMYKINKFIEQFKDLQKNKVKLTDKKCFFCGRVDNLSAHHIHPESSFNKYDLSAHYFENLISLCNECHGKLGQRLDSAILKSNNEKEFSELFPEEYEKYKKIIQYTEKRFISYFPIPKNFIEKLNEEQRNNLALEIFNELRYKGFPYSKYSDEDLLKDFNYVQNSKCCLTENTLRNFNSSGSKFRETFIHEQYINFLKLFDNDETLLKVIRNRLGLDWKNNSEFFNLSYKMIITGFEILFPDKRYSKYKPTTAKWIIDTYCKGDEVFDYSAGWGDRMLGAIAANKKYIGLDTNERLIKELETSADWLRTYKNAKIELINKNSSEYNKPISFAYSCPPYGNQEVYNGSNFKNDLDWLEKFMIPVINMCYKNLCKDGIFVCHLPIRLSGIVKNELNVKFEILNCIKVFNTLDAYHGGKNRQNEIILIYKKS